MAYETLLLDQHANVAVLTLNRPRVLNALNAALLRELDEALRALGDDPSVRVLILRGSAGKAFAAGADIGEMAGADATTGEELARRVQRIFGRIEALGKPAIACIDGYALGGGCELAMACTLRLANSAARLGQPEIKLGLIPGYGGSQRLPRLVGQGAALKMLLTGGMVDAAEAFRIGLVDEVVEGDSEALLARALELAQAIAAMPPLAVAAILESVRLGAGLPLGMRWMSKPASSAGCVARTTSAKVRWHFSRSVPRSGPAADPPLLSARGELNLQTLWNCILPG